MSYHSWKKRPPREFRGKPQWTLDVEVMDHYLRRLSEGKDVVKDFCRIYGLRTEDMDSLVFILTGMKGQDFRMAYQLRLADDLLRYTDLPLAEVARLCYKIINK